MESASRQRSSVSGKCRPMSPRPATPRRASITACVRTSASLWPARPASDSSISTPPRTSRRPASRRWVSKPMPARSGALIGPTPRAASELSADRLQQALPALEHRQLAHSEVAQPLHRALVLVPELLRRVGVARQRHRAARLQAHLEERRGRVDLARRLAEARGRHLFPYTTLFRSVDVRAASPSVSK